MKTYTKQEIAHLMSCSIRTINDDCTHLEIVPRKGDRNMNLYTERDFNLISQLRKHCKNKYSSRDSFVPLTVSELIDDEPKVTKLTQRGRGNSIDSSKDEVSPSRVSLQRPRPHVATSRFGWEASHPKADCRVDRFGEEAIRLGLSHDPLFDLELLQRISDKKWLLPTKRLALLFGITGGYLNSINQYSYCGFVAKKKIYAHNRALWKIRRESWVE